MEPFKGSHAGVEYEVIPTEWGFKILREVHITATTIRDGKVTQEPVTIPGLTRESSPYLMVTYDEGEWLTDTDCGAQRWRGYMEEDQLVSGLGKIMTAAQIEELLQHAKTAPRAGHCPRL